MVVENCIGLLLMRYIVPDCSGSVGIALQLITCIIMSIVGDGEFLLISSCNLIQLLEIDALELPDSGETKRPIRRR